MAAERGHHRGGRACSSRARTPSRPFNTLVVRGAAEASYRKIHLYDSFGYRESDRLTAGATEPVVVEVGGLRASG